MAVAAEESSAGADVVVAEKNTFKETPVLSLDGSKLTTHLEQRHTLPLPEAVRETADWYANAINDEDMEAYTHTLIQDRFS